MTEGPKHAGEARPASREERLAAKLRENLRRRKAQARAAAGLSNGPRLDGHWSDAATPPLPKEPPES